MMRLDRFLSEMGAGTRSEIKEACRKKQVRVNGELAKKSDLKVDPDMDQVEYKGSPVVYAAYEYYMLNKPAGVVTAVVDPHQKTVIDLITGQSRKDLFPVGRLDKDTEGLLLITNDGPLCQKLLSPKHHVDKVYYARTSGEMKPECVDKFREGLDIGDEKLTQPAELKILSVKPVECTAEDAEASGYESEILLTLTEGRYHQVKRMCEVVGCTVIYLKRLSMGSLKLDENLAAGEYRKLTEEEVEMLRK